MESTKLRSGGLSGCFIHETVGTGHDLSQLSYRRGRSVHVCWIGLELIPQLLGVTGWVITFEAIGWFKK